MKVLVTGANGFLAGHIIRELLKKNYQVRAMYRAGSDAPALNGLDVELFHGNITNPGDVNNAAAGCDYIIHTAADTSQNHIRMSDYFRVNYEATRFVAESALMHDCKRLVFVGTANAFGSGTPENPGDEKRVLSSLFKRSGYAVSKKAAQDLVKEYCSKNGLNAVIVNPSFMLGELDYKPSSGKIFRMILGKRIAFYPPGGKNFVSVKAVAAATVNALNYGISGEAYLLTGTDMSYRDFFRLASEKAGQNTWLIPVPALSLLLAGTAGSLLKLCRIKTSVDLTNTRILCRKFHYSNEKAREHLFLEECNIHNVTQECIDWFIR